MRFNFIAILALVVAIAVTAGPSANSSSAAVDWVRVFIDVPTYGVSEEATLRGLGGNTRYFFSGVNTISVELPAQVIPILERNPRFRTIRPVPAVSVVEDTLPWGIDQVDAERVWGGVDKAVNVQNGANDGTGSVVAVLDTGIASHYDLNIIGGVSLVSGVSSYHDGHGHGTHVAGTIAAKDNGSGVLGVAPGAGLLAVKVLRDSGGGYLDDVAAGINWAAQNGAHVINMSLSCSGSSACDDPVMRQALQNAQAANVVIVAAAGNSGSGSNTVGWPARNAETIAVAATTSSNARASFSSTGPDVEIAAPGQSIYSTYPGGFATMSGTSMAAPHVAGAAALLANCGHSASQIRSILTSTADDLGSTGRDNQFGYGLLDVDEAVNCGGGGTAAPPQQPQAITEGFESGNWSGGTGWITNWSRSGSSSYTSILTSSGPQEGSRHARIRANGALTRSFSTAGQTGLTLTYWAKRNTSVSGSDRVHVEMSLNGSSNWVSLYQHSSSNTGTGYQQYVVDVPAGMQDRSTVYLRFRGAMNSSSDYFYLDGISIGASGSPGPSGNATATPTSTSSPPTATPTGTGVPPTATNTTVPPTATTTTVPPTATNTSVPTATNTPFTPPTATATQPPSSCSWILRLFGFC